MLAASGASVILVVVAGTGMVAQPWFAARHFHVEYIIPWVVGLAVTRAWGAWGAAVVVCFHVTALHHSGFFTRKTPNTQGGTDELRVTWSRGRLATVAACSVPILYFPVGLLALATAMVITRAAFGLHAGDYFHLLNLGDVGFGICTAVVLGVVPALWTFTCEKLFSWVRRGLGFKLFITWLCMLCLSVAFGLVLCVVEPAEADDEVPLLGHPPNDGPTP
jgi:hypothetical protein